jgi:thiamine-monophosphate kinase
MQQQATHSDALVTASGFSEERVLRAIANRSKGQALTWGHVLVGPGDDCAVLKQDAGEGISLLLKVDQVVEGRHFVSGTPLHLVARKAVARVVSDCAAMGGEPTAFLASCVLPSTMSEMQAEDLARSVHAWCEHFGAPCVGGDVTRQSAHQPHAPLVLSISALGRVRGKAVLRSGAQTGDGVWITGCVGGSFEASPTARDAFAGGGHHLHFEPRVREGVWLRGALVDALHAMIDVSDGLGLDAGRLARASNVAIELNASSIPLRTPTRSVRDAVRDGEDYELLIAISARARHEPMPETLAPLTRIGRVLAPSEACPAGSVWLVEDNKRERIEALGWD